MAGGPEFTPDEIEAHLLLEGIDVNIHLCSATHERLRVFFVPPENSQITVEQVTQALKKIPVYSRPTMDIQIVSPLLPQD